MMRAAALLVPLLLWSASASAQQAAAPSEEALALARTVAGNGFLIALIPVQTTGEIEGMIAEHPELTPAEQVRLRAIGQEQASRLREQVIQADATALAKHLPVEDLRVIAAFEGSEAAARRRTAMPAIMVEVMTTLGQVDYGGGVRQAFCAETRKLCED